MYQLVPTFKLVLSNIAADQKTPLTATITGIGEFPAKTEGEPRPIIAQIRAGDINEFREKIVRELDADNIFYSKAFEFTPHITLAWASEGDSKTFTVDRTEIEFGHVNLVVADHWHSFVFNKVPAGMAQRIVWRDWMNQLGQAQNCFVDLDTLARLEASEGITEGEANELGEFLECLSGAFWIPSVAKAIQSASNELNLCP